jgi:hypothetical protein
MSTRSHLHQEKHWSCLPACGRSFATEQGLNAHQDSCKLFAREDKGLQGLAERLADRKARKRRRISEKAKVRHTFLIVGYFLIQEG